MARRYATAGWVLSFAVVTACVIAYIIDPDGLGGWAFAASALVCLMAMAVVPITRRFEPAVWASVTAAGVAFLLGFVARMLDLGDAFGPLEWADVFSFSAYLFLVAFLVMLLRRLGAHATRNTATDTLLIGFGASLALWTITFAPEFRDGAHVEAAIVAAAYPVFDVVLLTLFAQLVFSVRVRSPSMWAFLAGLVILQVVDTAYTFVWLSEPAITVPALSALYLYAIWCFAVGMCHPSLGRLTNAGQPSEGYRSGRRAVLLLSAVTPVVLSIFYPRQGFTDGVVRAALVTALFALLFIRLSTTMSSLERAEARSRHRALHDPLTGLPNRAAFLKALGGKLATTTGWLCVLYVDCDHFKKVNDTWGHHAGDVVLQEIAARLSSRVRRTDFVARLGGDEFVWMAVVQDPGEVPRLAQRLMDAFEEPISLGNGQRIAVTPSIGISLGDQRAGFSQEQALAQADIALYDAKARGRGGWALFDDTLAMDFERRAVLIDELRQALDDDAIDVHLQPIMGGDGFGWIVGWEALARWRHPRLGLLGPESFIPLAEQSGLIHELGAHVMKSACDGLALLRRQYGRDDLIVSVNLSTYQLGYGRLARVVSSSLTAADLPPDALWLEITESAIAERVQSLTELAELRDLGISVCVDDFGAGFSSLARLQALPADYVKLDRLFVAELETKPRARAVARAVIQMLVAVGVRAVVAEGVETLEQAAVLAEIGCPMGQGWYFGKPGPWTQMAPAPLGRSIAVA